MENEKIKKVIEAAKMYYQLDYSQNQIAEMLGVSRPTVSRLLQQAKSEGIVQIEIKDFSEDIELLENSLREKFQLKNAIIAYTPTYESEIVKKYIGQTAADYLSAIVKDGDTIAASWGTTMYQVAQHLQQKAIKDARVVQLNGGVSDADVVISPSNIVYLIGQAFHTTPYLMYLPAVVDHILVKQAILTDRHVRKVMDMGAQANVAIYTVGVPSKDSALMKANYFQKEELEIIRERAVGDICSRYFDKNGEICLPSLNERTIGIELHDLRTKEHAILAAGGADRVEAIYGAIKGRYANTLVTDQITAKSLLSMHEFEEQNKSSAQNKSLG